MEILYGAKNGVHAFGYNSAGSKPIWMKYEIWITVSILLGAGPGRSLARSGQ